MKSNSGKWKGIVFLLMLSAMLFFGGSRQVSAATKCKVTFANSNGVVSNNTYKSWAKTVYSGQTIALPSYSHEGYKFRWEVTDGKTTKKYIPGTKYKVTKNVKFCLKSYKLYTIKFYTDGGGAEYSSIRKQALKGQTITLPSVPSSATRRGYGWSTSPKDTNYKKPGVQVKVTGHMRFYSKTKASTGVSLYKYDGQYWKTIHTDTGSTPTFPAVNFGSLNNCLGWSRTMGSSKPEYYAGDKIPTKTGKYYMVKFGPGDDKAPASLYKTSKYDMVYFVGDSRTVQMSWAMGSKRPSNVDFVAQGGKGLNWFVNQGGYDTLVKKISNQIRSDKDARIAVVINLGVNDMQNCSAYIRYMKNISEGLKMRFNCSMYYMSLNPINSAVIEANRLMPRTEAQVAAFNRNIYRGLCSGSNRYFTYINTYDVLRRHGWLSNPRNMGRADGLHYSNATYLRIYNHAISKL